jgi:hypothetical protein
MSALAHVWNPTTACIRHIVNCENEHLHVFRANTHVCTLILILCMYIKFLRVCSNNDNGPTQVSLNTPMFYILNILVILYGPTPCAVFSWPPTHHKWQLKNRKQQRHYNETQTTSYAAVLKKQHSSSLLHILTHLINILRIRHRIKTCTKSHNNNLNNP